MHGNHFKVGHHQDPDETTPSDVSERPSVDDVESDTGSTGALETRSLKDHKGTVTLSSVYNLVFALKSSKVKFSFYQHSSCLTLMIMSALFHFCRLFDFMLLLLLELENIFK